MSDEEDDRIQPAQSVALQAVLDYSRHMEGSQPYGRAWVLAAEVLNMVPLRLTEHLTRAASVALQSVFDALIRMYEDGLENAGHKYDSPENRQFAEEACGRLMIDSLTRIVSSVGAIENFLYNETFQIDEDLCAEGWIRFKHHLGVDYTHLEEDKQLLPEIKLLENKLADKFRSIESLKQELSLLNAQTKQYDNLEQWLAPLDNEFPDLAGDVSELATIVHELSEVCDEKVDEKLEKEKEQDPLKDELLLRIL